ncbi:MAG: hypothetical protein ACLTXM_06415 [Enterococcus sp.]
MRYIIGVFFLLLAMWQFWMTKRSFTGLRRNGNENTSPFIMLGQWHSLSLAIGFLIVAIACFFVDIFSFY